MTDRDFEHRIEAHKEERTQGVHWQMLEKIGELNIIDEPILTNPPIRWSDLELSKPTFYFTPIQ